MVKQDRLPAITWKLHLRSPPADVYRFLATAEGRRRFWAESAEQIGEEIEFRFSNGATLRSRIIFTDPSREFRLSYFEDSTVTFRLEEDGKDGTDLVLTEEGVDEANWSENHAGWISMLLSLKAAVDHGVDLRNHDPSRTWEDGYVDV